MPASSSNSPLRQPSPLRTIAFFDGQNLYKASKALWGYEQVNYHPKKLAELVCRNKGWELRETKFYTGIPPLIHPETGKINALRTFWDNKIKSMTSDGVIVFTRELRYAEENGVWRGREKGIDVRIAIDVAMSIVFNKCDVALIFSQDQDLNEVAREVRPLSRALSRWVKIASAFPCDESAAECKNRINARGINGTDWYKISRAEYDACIDGNRYI